MVCDTILYIMLNMIYDLNTTQYNITVPHCVVSPYNVWLTSSDLVCTSGNETSTCYLFFYRNLSFNYRYP